MCILTSVHGSCFILVTLCLLLHTATAAITGLTIAEADTGKEVGPLEPNAVFKRSELPDEMSIVATADNPGDTATVEFSVNGVKVQTEKHVPYAIKGDKDSGKTYHPWPVPEGEIKLSVKQTLKSGGDDVFNLTFTVNPDGGSGTPTVSPSPSSSVGTKAAESSIPVSSISPTPSSGSAGTDSVKINIGSPDAVDDFIGDDGSFITGTTKMYSSTGDGIYKTHRWGADFGLDIKLSPGSYDVTLHFSDNFKGTCAEGKRVFTVTVGDKPPLEDLDIFKEAGGCSKPLTKEVKDVEVTDSMIVSLKSSVENAIISGIEVVPAGTGGTSTGSPTPSSTVGTKATETSSPVASVSPTPSKGSDIPESVKINMGSSEAIDGFIVDDGSFATGTSKTYLGPGEGIYKTHRWGADFGLDIKLTPGSYTVKLHFSDNFKTTCAEGKRVFTVTVGDKPPLENLDIFTEAGGCSKPLIKEVKEVEVKDSLIVKFKSSVENAIISGIEVVTVGTSPEPTVGSSGPETPPPTPAGAIDDNAHAVPPIFDDPIVDLKKEGEVTVNMDGSGSHTHFFDSDSGQFAVLKYYKWTNNETDDVLCEGADQNFCKHTFPLGSTTVKLCVTDTADFVNCAETTVAVVESIAPGVYCYYYDFGSSTEVKVPLKIGLEAGKEDTPKPLFGEESKEVSFPTLSSFPEFSFKANSWAQRCLFFFAAPKIESYKFTVKHIGGVSLFVGDEQVISADASNTAKTSEGVIEIPEGLQKLDLIYYKVGDAAQMELSYNATAVQFEYDKATVLPIIDSITPNTSNLEGTFIKVTGLNINTDTNVTFGDQDGTDPIYDAPTQVQVNAPKVTEEATVNVVLSNIAGTSNSFPYTYTSTAAPPSIKFTQTEFKDYAPNGVANIAIGPDLKYYMSTATGKIIVADVDHENGYAIKSTCESETLSDPAWISSKTKEPAPRWALGITFNPKETSVKAYVATSSLFWGPGEQDYLEDDFAWANGNVEVLEPGDGCIKRTEILIKGLPVSNHDHAINSLVFDNKGDLHFLVGGFTNQGIPGEKLGGVDENPLSAASVVALLSKGSEFDGTITYDNKDPVKAKQTGGDVEIYATGLRNSYGITLHSNGLFYATDNGPNNGFGKRSETCTTELSDKQHGDKILQLKKGKYYGSPNRNRGECVFIDDAGKTPSGEDPAASLNFDPPLATVASSTNGIIEYTANTFEGQLRGNLFASKYAGSGDGKVWRMGLKDDGTLDFGPDQFSTFFGGLSIVQGHRGEIIMPQVKKNKVIVLKPDYAVPDHVDVLAVTPFRGGKEGGNVVLVTGHNFESDVTVLFGESPCTDVADLTKTSFKCTTPPGEGVVNVTVSVNGNNDNNGNAGIAPGAFWYMDI